jgi:hypothetical protein
MHFTFKEVGLQENIKDVTRKTFNRVVEGKNVYPLAILDVVTGVNADEVAELDAKVIPCDLVELDAAFLYIVPADADKDCVLTLLATT